jgi:hypothetical protein
VLVVGAPNGFSPAVRGAEACPNTGAPGLCSNPVTDIADFNGTYTLTLPPGAYHIAGFYELKGNGPKFLGVVENVSVTSSTTTTANLPVPYAKPATLTGKVTITNVPKSDPVRLVKPLLCPSSEPFTGGTPSSDCLTRGSKATTKTTAAGSISASGMYTQSGLPAGSYIAYPGYCATQSTSCVVSTSGVAVTLTAGTVTTQNLKTTFLQGNQGLVFGKVTVTGAPTGFSPQLGAQACEVSTSTCVQVLEPTGQDYNLVLNAGAWDVQGFYLSGSTPVFGSTVPEVVTAGSMIHAHLTVAYQVSAVGHR